MPGNRVRNASGILQGKLSGYKLVCNQVSSGVAASDSIPLEVTK
jgi:hypothetical protein